MGCTLLDDSRRIRAIVFQEGRGYLAVKQGGVKSIEVEAMHGQGANVAWFAVRWDDGRFHRYNAAFLECVEYEPGPQGEDDEESS